MTGFDAWDVVKVPFPIACIDGRDAERLGTISSDAVRSAVVDAVTGQFGGLRQKD